MIEKFELEIYETASGKSPFEEWVETLRDWKAVAKIQSRLDRVVLGNFGDHSSLREGVCELRINFGPGYRVYFSKIGKKIVLLLCGGIKRSQDSDIEKAIRYLKDYMGRRK